MENTFSFTSPIGNLVVSHQEGVITAVLFQTEKNISKKTNPTIVKEFEKYFKNPSHSFTFPIKLNGTPFQTRVWKALQQIPSGSTLTYGDLAKKLKTSPRAIGQACRTNPVLIIVPCHRIVAANHLGGFSGSVSGKWPRIKKWLLTHESAVK